MPILITLVIERCPCGNGTPHCNMTFKAVSVEADSQEIAEAEQMRDAVVAKAKEIIGEQERAGHTFGYGDSQTAKREADEFLRKHGFKT